MLKGHTTIELRDVVTGEVKKYEDDNMMTNYIGKMIDFACKHSLGNNPLNPYTAHWSNLLSSLVMFSQPLTEDADAFWLPAGTKPIAYGVQGDTNSYVGINSWGVYNSVESDTSATATKKMVWDFSTNHANGTIAAVALTHRNSGYWGLGINQNNDIGYNPKIGKISLGTCLTQSSKGKQARNQGSYGTVGTNLSQNSGTYVDFCIDSENDVKYMLRVCQDGISIIKHHLYPEYFNIFRQMQTPQPYEEETYAETFGSGYFYRFYNPDEQVLYFWIWGSAADNYGTSATLAIHKFDMQTKTLTKNWKTGVVLSSDGADNIKTGFVITDTALYYGTYSPAKLRKHTFSGGTNTTITTVTTAHPFYGNRMYILNGLIYLPSAGRMLNQYGEINGTLILDTSDDTIRYTYLLERVYAYQDNASHGEAVPPIDTTQIAFGAMLNAGETFNSDTMDLQQSGNDTWNAGNLWCPVHYLGTINNLSESIIKTAQQTMKVTYTITEESNG